MDSAGDNLDLMVRVPVRNPDLALDGELLLDSRKAGEATYLNSSAVLIWGLCDGANTVREIIELIEAAGIGDPVVVRSDVIAALKDMDTKGIIRMSGNDRRAEQ